MANIFSWRVLLTSVLPILSLECAMVNSVERGFDDTSKLIFLIVLLLATPFLVFAPWWNEGEEKFWVKFMIPLLLCNLPLSVERWIATQEKKKQREVQADQRRQQELDSAVEGIRDYLRNGGKPNEALNRILNEESEDTEK